MAEAKPVRVATRLYNDQDPELIAILPNDRYERGRLLRKLLRAGFAALNGHALVVATQDNPLTSSALDTLPADRPRASSAIAPSSAPLSLGEFDLDPRDFIYAAPGRSGDAS